MPPRTMSREELEQFNRYVDQKMSELITRDDVIAFLHEVGYQVKGDKIVPLCAAGE